MRNHTVLKGGLPRCLDSTMHLVCWVLVGHSALLAALSPAVGSELISTDAPLEQQRAFSPGARWTDIYGEPIHAHAGHLLLVGGLYHWYGMASIGCGKDPSCAKPKAAFHAGVLPVAHSTTTIALRPAGIDSERVATCSECVRVDRSLQLGSCWRGAQLQSLHIATKSASQHRDRPVRYVVQSHSKCCRFRRLVAPRAIQSGLPRCASWTASRGTDSVSRCPAA